VDATHNLAVLVGQKKDRDPAVERDLLEKVVEADPEHAQGHLSLGRFYHMDAKFRDLDKAVAHYQRYVYLERDDRENAAAISRTIQAIKAAQASGNTAAAPAPAKK
jgi:hypothetical protein